MSFQPSKPASYVSKRRSSHSGKVPAGVAALMLTASAAAMMSVMMAGSARADCDFPTPGNDNITCDADFGGGFGVNALDGDDVVDITGGTYTDSITGGNGLDTITLVGGTVDGGIAGQGNMDTILLLAGTVGTVLGDGPDMGGDDVEEGDFQVLFIPEPPAADTITLNGAVVTGTIHGNEGDDLIILLSGSALTVAGDEDNDTITLAGASIGGMISGNDGNDIIDLLSGTAGSVDGDAGNDTITLNGASIGGNIFGGADDDVIDLISGTVSGFGGVLGGIGEDVITLSGATVDNLILGGEENDLIVMSGGAANGIMGENGNDTIILNGGIVVNDVMGGDGADTITLDGASVGDQIKGDGGADQIFLLSGAALHVEGNNGADTILLDGATITGDILGQGLTDVIQLNSGSVSGDVFGDGPDFIDGFVDPAGSDLIQLAGATIGGDINGGDFGDTIQVFSGLVSNVNGEAGADTIQLFGGVVSGNINGGDAGDIIQVSGGLVTNVNGEAGGDILQLFDGVISGDINGGSENDLVQLFGGSVANVNGEGDDDNILLSGATVSGNLTGGNGNDIFNLTSGSFGGDLNGGDGSDQAFIGAGYDPSTIVGNLDGGDDALVGDGFIDFLQVGASGTLTGDNIINWETIEILNANVTLIGTGLTTEETDWFGLMLTNSTLDLNSNAFAIVGDVSIDPSSVLQADTPTGTGVFSISDDLINGNIIDMSDGFGAGDTLTVGGDYTANSDLFLDVALDSTEAGDSLVIIGDVLGTGTELTLTDTNPFGAPSFTGTGPGNGILLVDNSVGGDIEPGDFIFDPIAHPTNEILKVPFVYTLSLESDDILYLQSDVLPQVYGYAILAELMREEFPILRDRLGDRRFNGMGDPEPSLADTDNAGIWARIHGRERDIEHDGGYKTGEWEESRGEAEIGIDIPMETFGGVGVFGVSIHAVRGYADANSGVSPDPSVTEVDTTGFGGGLSFAWFPGGGFYADVQGRVTGWDADVENEDRDINQDIDGLGWGASLEIGKRFQIATNTAIIPRSQVVYTDVDFDNFEDDDGVDVSQDDSASVVIGPGVTIEQMFPDNGVAMFLDASVKHELLDESSIDASGFKFESGLDDTWGKVQIGAAMDTGAGTSAYIATDISSPFGSDFGDSYSYGLKAGFRIDF